MKLKGPKEGLRGRLNKVFGFGCLGHLLVGRNCVFYHPREQTLQPYLLQDRFERGW